MEFEIWWLLSIPIFFGLGWIAARIDIKQLLSESRSLPKGYFKGLNFLLNEQPDKAIDAFIEIVRLDSETADLHFALGNLFRRRGETERAIRMHQNLLLRPDLPPEQRMQAQYELGQDFLRAGLLDRAEEVFQELTETAYSIQARRALLEIFQREKEWVQAIDAAKALQNSGTGNRNKQIAQFYCELAEDELVNTHPEKALPLLETALSTDRMSVRATILTGDALVALGKPEEALATWRRVEKQSISHTVLVAQRLMEGFQSVGRPQEGISLLKSYLSETASIDLLEVLFKAVLKQEGVEAANTLVHDELRRTPTLLGLDKLLEAQLLVVPPEIREDLSFVRNLVQRYASRLSRYQCSHCGFEARQFYWQCPGCHQWETYPPKRVEEMKLSS
ncbi:lipopolysaccharide assembly protein LapB [Oxalobacter aliiformigenes]|uniref:lipopolysaccharide assembly protein LapB n=1 Tax=Oxalobacter aliiformigenes TaxID=2946593 RepID=UPI0022AF47A7|nr:lipopolysaccharide assembly protein LapB [Oxalobacter aliiformigenes]MCZ4064260.1 lipopolysaccharide assembly protein LapB [Oxalobacter aliiformigenes]WAV98807.1 lipopolysaccharide assembly protein LapB [Oxalobacter aliiformigenes]